MNCLTLIGRVALPPVYHCTKAGHDLTRFTLNASPGTEGEDTHECISWGPAALDLHENLRVGDRLMLRGRLRYKWRQLPGGKRFRMAEIAVRSYTYLGHGGMVEYRR
ncbi:single-stranded DNA-binding protein [Lewinella sp. W8]|uniref:single-stranded DNA-binding protein n=1 Tax=Lewinella sp. W8 TaxID=2528208 RepID=UPI001068B725|nr:single-stranded DNA-binding protein [Lewinella sp. W8]MTB53776.1 single-stranded DNA-binding protein [Lewinella sp. W8]